MADFPYRGQEPYGDLVKAYVDSGDAGAVTAAVATAVAQVETETATSGSNIDNSLKARYDQRYDMPTVILRGPGIDLTGATDSTTAVQAKINAALAYGARIRAVDGATYQVSALTAVNAVGLAIEGNGVTFVGTDDSQRVFTFTNCTGLALRGSVTVKHLNHATRTTGYGVFVNGGDDITINGWTVRQVSAAGILVGNGATRVRIAQTIVRDNLADGIHVTGGSTDVTVVGNVLTTTGDDAIAVVSYDGDAAGPVKRVTITGNTVYQSNARGITCVGGEGVTITGNTVVATNASGIYVAQEDTYATRAVKNVTVVGNTVVDANTYNSPATTQPSIYVTGGNATKPVTNVMVANNTIKGGAGRGINVATTVYGAVDQVTVTGNHITGNLSGSAIELSYIPIAFVHGNASEFSYGNGVYADSHCGAVGLVSNRVYYPNQGNASGIYAVYNGSATGMTGPNYIIADTSKTTLLGVGGQAYTNGTGAVGFSTNLSANQIQAGATSRAFLAAVGFYVAGVAQQYSWGTGANIGADPIDTGLARDAAGVVRVTDGSTGTGTLKAAKVTGANGGSYLTAAKIKTGEYVTPQGLGSNAFTATIANNTATFVPIDIPVGFTADRIGLNITGAGAGAGPVIRLGIFDSGTDGRPGALLVDGGTIDASTTGNKTVTISQALPAGRVWVCAVAQASATTAPTVSVLRGAMPGVAWIGSAPVTNGGAAFQATGTSGALASNPTLTGTAGDAPLLYVRSA